MKAAADRKNTDPQSRKISYTTFATPIGTFAIAWSEQGLVRVQFPEDTSDATLDAIHAKFPGAGPAQALPDFVEAAISRINATLLGQTELTKQTISLDFTESAAFHRSVYLWTQAIPAGATCSYGEVARALGMPKAARAVGQALARNPYVIIVPCHRVLASDGRLRGFSAPGGLQTKQRLLATEAATRLQSTQAHPWLPLAGVALRSVAHLRESDPLLSALIDEIGPFRMRFKSAGSTFEALAETIIHQQLSGRSASAIHRRFESLFENLTDSCKATRLLTLTDETLRSAGLSGSKTLALRDLAEKCVNGTVPTLAELDTWDNDEIIERLSTVRGIGRWSVEMLLMFHLGRPDILPVDDFGVRKGYANLHGWTDLPKPRELTAYGERWRPYRTVASWYLWRAAELPPRTN